MRVERLIKQKLRLTVHSYIEVIVLGLIRLGHHSGNLLTQSQLRGLRKRRHVQSAIHPNAAFESSACAFADNLERFEADKKRRNDLARFRRPNGRVEYFVDNSIAALRQVANLLRLG